MSGSSTTQTTFLGRFYQAYVDGLNTPSGESNDDNTGTPRRIPGPPLESPPFPSADWVYGGTPTLGATNGYAESGPLMAALHGTDIGTAMENARISIYGWAEGGGNLSTSWHKAGNSPAAYDYQPNSIQLDQYALYIERDPDENQTDHIDWGFRITGLYGTDFRYTTGQGYLSNPFIKQNRQYGLDIPMAYVDLWLPGIGYGTNVRAGRYISLPDIEAQLAPDNYFFSHSLLYVIDPFTQTGMVASTMLDPKGQWIIQYGVSAGNDVAPNQKSAQATGTLCGRWTSSDVNDNIYVCANSTNGGNFGYNNLQGYYATWYHRFADPHWHTGFEYWYMYQKNTPAAGTVTGYGVNGPFGADCHTGTRCTSYEQAGLNYIMYEVDSHNAIGLRNEFLYDAKGQRTGFATLYTEHAISWQHFFSESIYIRPEVRYERSYQQAAYNGGTKKDQAIFAADLVFKY